MPTEPALVQFQQQFVSYALLTITRRANKQFNVGGLRLLSKSVSNGPEGVGSPHGHPYRTRTLLGRISGHIEGDHAAALRRLIDHRPAVSAKTTARHGSVTPLEAVVCGWTRWRPS